MFSAPFIRLWIWVLTPLNFLFSQWKKLVSRFFKTNDDAKMSHEELLLFMEDVEQDGGIDENEGELLRNALEFRDLTAAEILTHRIELEAVDIDESHEEIARAFTPVSYTHLLLNLLENAVFHAKGMTELTLSVSLVGDKAVFEVADNGCGIPDDALQKIFAGSYEKSAAPVDGTRSNMGIGLSVCAAIVKAHGSEITAENRKGGGAVFRFALERGGEDDGQ